MQELIAVVAEVIPHVLEVILRVPEVMAVVRR